MVSTRTSSSARRASRPTFGLRTAPAAAVVGLLALTGFTASLPAYAADSTVPTSYAAGGGAVTLEHISADAEATMAEAQSAVDEAASVNAEVDAAGLDLGAGPSFVDLSDLHDDIAQLSTHDIIPTLLLPQITDDAAAETTQVRDETAALSDRLEQARVRKAEAEAAAAAAAEKKRQEAAAAALAAASTPAGAQAIAQQIAASEYGWGADQFSCLVSLWQKESGWNASANNPSSGAYGIPQSLPGSKMATVGADWQTNPETQIRWGLQYIAAAYGAPCGAWSHSQAVNWY